MEPIQHSTNNTKLIAEGCNDLPVTKQADVWTSFWQPEAEELAALNAGGSVALQIHSRGGHPPVSVRVAIPEQPIHHDMDFSQLWAIHKAMLVRHRATVAILKSALAEWTKEKPDSKQRAELVDRFLDLMNTNQGRESDPMQAAIVSPVEWGEG